MPDMLIKLYALQNDWRFLSEQAAKGITIRKVLGGEKHVVVTWVRQQFNASWASEAEIAISAGSRNCFVAVKDGRVIGFCCYDAAALGFCGPIGIQAGHRRQKTGKALLLACLLDMKLKGYGYAIIGWTDNLKFYNKVAGAVEISDSDPGLFKGYLT
jgi:GNAT superfamily N-acetyltransferase